LAGSADIILKVDNIGMIQSILTQIGSVVSEKIFE
jgi:hypothetical protein